MAVLRFDGHAYPDNPSLTPKLPETEAAAGTSFRLSEQGSLVYWRGPFPGIRRTVVAQSGRAPPLLWGPASLLGGTRWPSRRNEAVLSPGLFRMRAREP